MKTNEKCGTCGGNKEVYEKGTRCPVCMNDRLIKNEHVVAMGGKGAVGTIITEEIRKKLLSKPGLIIAIYPGMGHELFCDVYENYAFINAGDYYTYELSMNGAESVIKEKSALYADDAIRLREQPGIDIVFVDAHVDIVRELVDRDEMFIIMYPSKEIKVKALKDRVVKINNGRITTKDNKISAQHLLNYLIDTLIFLDKGHESKLDELRMYSNSIAAATGIPNEDLVKTLAEAKDSERKKIIKIFADMKQYRDEDGNRD